ncbi:unnamed protein product (macronuclear) [Paramecium tetraurelia]|uniref:Mitochondrial import inner membrane translocase subunit TIM50 n=1 Tax=Paramecium tetraurelia TaxID=5888 RepID=A0EDA0_PARTE|nr:uncharacterized protein GSPATT00004136001 [Paramecium tetraurelia]CAK93267.1 unnamed protein product [Paramecium tetraurelia]|eukprot:XP_001460664.1 hypothetical protein (macronuclear) [Paramecium tetraurelia strain d4-2]
MNQRNKIQGCCSNLSLPQLTKKTDENCAKTLKQITPTNTLKKIGDFQGCGRSTSQLNNAILNNLYDQASQKSKVGDKPRKDMCSRAHTIYQQQQNDDQLRKQIQYNDYFIGGIKEILGKEICAQNLKQMCIDQLNQIYKNVTCKDQTFISKKQLPNIVLTKKYSIAIDLDETLVHSEELKPNRRYDFQNLQFGTFIRPYCLQFLQLLNKHANLFVFTSSNIKYATTIMQILDPQKDLFQGLFFRDHCTILQDNSQVKDIKIISSDLTKIILIDNNPQCFIPEPFNGIPIVPFLDNKADKELLILSQFIEREIFTSEDVQHVIKRFFQFQQFRQFENGMQAYQILYN